MRCILAGLVLLAASAAAEARGLVYEGTWVTTNRKLDGTLKCVVTDLGNNRWRGHFSGSWQGRKFSYKVDFTGPPDRLRGRAVIDGADYQWTGKMDTAPGGSFKGQFGGSRYAGRFSLKRTSD
jgi:hypothetical protein